MILLLLYCYRIRTYNVMLYCYRQGCEIEESFRKYVDGSMKPMNVLRAHSTPLSNAQRGNGIEGKGVLERNQGS